MTASVRLRRLNLFCIQYAISPKELVSIGEEDARKLEDLLHDHVSYLESKQYAPRYIDDILKAIKIAIQELMKEKESERYDSLLIDEDNLVLYVKKGWDIVKELSSGRILICKLV
ncbi:hypothetical protein [Candidatus Nitrosotalea okcheonensis]|uniref:Uncharacterized protein n=1 Tax=Candidatus Nitrosotalea okcheonensis TaxID=1903276 RepID=A0A2H1FHL6_9ARCH|nr:hypothetical protein [Candidatus Nitrosotalea okcheonensis]SMH72266.1 protein of unknown function [Candidatus Nitrosotalea okcheonensis]